MVSEPRPSLFFRSALRMGLIVPVLIGLCTAVELLLMAADAGLVGTARWRPLAYQYGGFWAGLLFDWRPNYALQPWTMFLTYAFLHGGFGHLAGNMLTLAVLGPSVRRKFGSGGFLAIYFAAAFGGALGFALLGDTLQPVVGASGALFGLAGALVYEDWSWRRRKGRRFWPVWRTIVLLAVLNAVLWVLLEGLLAWETHLGGFVAGWAAAAATGTLAARRRAQR